MTKKITIPLAVIGILTILFIAWFGYRLFSNYYLPSKTVLPSPLQNVSFPFTETQYTADWPDDLKFPNDFLLVDSSSGTLPEGTAIGWAAKFRYYGSPMEASQAIVLFLSEHEWTVVEDVKLDAEGISLLVQRQDGSGVIVLGTDPNDPSQTLIVASLFP